MKFKLNNKLPKYTIKKRTYCRVSEEQQAKLLHLIHKEHYSCYRAAAILKISYQNAKAINRRYNDSKRELPTIS